MTISEHPLQWSRSRVRVGDWIIIFGAAAEVLEVRDSASFQARQLLLRTMDAQLHTTLVPVDYEPVAIDWATSTNAGPPPRHVSRTR